MTEVDDAVVQLQQYAALNEPDARAVVEAVLGAARDEALDQIVDDSLVPASVADARTARLARICSHLGRLLSPGEVEVILRVPPPTAQSTLNRLRAGYRHQVDGWIRNLVVQQAEPAQDVSTDTDPDRWLISFKDPTSLDYAVELLRRIGMTRGISVDRKQQTLTVPKLMRDRRGDQASPLDVLGLPAP